MAAQLLRGAVQTLGAPGPEWINSEISRPVPWGATAPPTEPVSFTDAALSASCSLQPESTDDIALIRVSE